MDLWVSTFKKNKIKKKKKKKVYWFGARNKRSLSFCHALL